MNERRPHRSRSVAVVAAAVLLFAACGDSTESDPVDTQGATTVPTTEAPFATETPDATDAPVASDVAPTTEAPPTTQAPPATTVAPAPPTTAPPGATSPPPPATDPPAASTPTRAELVLRPNGIGPFDFGTITPTDFVAAVTPALGAPTSSTAASYPTASGDLFENDDEGAFAFPFGEEICFGNALCAHFGGGAAGSLVLVGYIQDESAGALATASGVTTGSVWASHAAAISLDEGGCFTVGYGTADGVGIVVRSSGDPFVVFTDDGTYVNQVPAQSDVTVLSLNAGEQSFYLFEDC